MEHDRRRCHMNEKNLRNKTCRTATGFLFELFLRLLGNNVEFCQLLV